MIPLGSQTVYVLTAATVHDHGTDVEDWDAPTAGRVRVDGCLVEPLSGQEVLANRDATQAAWRVLMPEVDAHGEPYRIDGRNRVEFQGVPHGIVGDPGLHPSPSGTLGHIEVLASSWRG